VVLGVVLLGMLLGGGVWWKMRRQEALAPAAKPITAPMASQLPASPPSIAGVAASDLTPAPASDALDLRPPTVYAALLRKLPQVTGIRHWTTADASIVVIDLQDQVQYEAHRLTNPERIYFDLRDTSLSPEWMSKTVEVGDALLVRVRAAQPVAGVTR